MKHYESRFCTFAVPDAWENDSPFEFFYTVEGQGRWSAQIREVWLSSPSGSEFIRRQGEWLVEQNEGLEVLAERPHLVSGPGEGRLFAIRLMDEEGDPARAWLIYLALGPLVCELTLSGPLQPERETDRVFEAIAKTFLLRSTEFFEALDRSLPGEGLVPLHTPFVQGWGKRQRFPRVCLSLPLVAGWDLEEVAGEPVFRRDGAEMLVQRVLGSDGDPDIWFSTRMQALHDAGSALLGYERGEAESGEFVALFYEERGITRSWRTAGIRRSLQILAEGPQPLLWTLTAIVPMIWDLRLLLASLMVAAEFLPEPDWELLVPEEWMNMVLKGPWYSEGKGVYRREGTDPLLLHLGHQPRERSLAQLREQIIDALQQGSPLEYVRSEDNVLGSWKGRDTLHYSADGRTNEGEPMSVRATWLTERRLLYSILVLGGDRDSVEEVSIQAVESLRL